VKIASRGLHLLSHRGDRDTNPNLMQCHATLHDSHPTPSAPLFLFAPAAAAALRFRPAQIHQSSPRDASSQAQTAQTAQNPKSARGTPQSPPRTLCPQLTNPRRAINPSIPPSGPTPVGVALRGCSTTRACEGPLCATPLHPRSARAPSPAYRPMLADDPAVCNTARPCCCHASKAAVNSLQSTWLQSTWLQSTMPGRST
jgi:hypothetical protein